jgi:hypothetical protein
VIATESPKAAAYAGALGEPYISTQHQPAPAFAVAVPNPAGGYRRKNFRWSDDPAATLEQAKAWRDQVHQELHGRPCPSRVFHRTQENSGTEIPGVREAIKKVKKKSKDGQTRTYTVPVVIAEITVEPGQGRRKAKSRSRVLSIAKHGRERALELASDWRRQQELLLAGEAATTANP